MNSSHGLSERELADLVDHVKTVCALYHLRIERDGVYRALEWMDPLYKAMLERAIVRNNSTISQFIGPTFRNVFGIDLLNPQPKPIEEPLGSNQLSFVARSNLYMMTIAAERNAKQAIPDRVAQITDDARILRARLIMEEALETCYKGLGVTVKAECMGLDISCLEFAVTQQLDVEETIDGCCDTIYVCIGTLMALGIPDLPHLKHVCERNDAKSPGGVSQTDSTGKVVKPEGWTPPNHEQLIEQSPSINLREIGQRIVERVKNGGKV